MILDKQIDKLTALKPMSNFSDFHTDPKQNRIVKVRVSILKFNPDLGEFHAIDLDYGLVFAFFTPNDDLLNIEIGKSYEVLLRASIGSSSQDALEKQVKFELLTFENLKQE